MEVRNHLIKLEPGACWTHQSDILFAGVDAIARHAGKLRGIHLKNGKPQPGSSLTHFLQVRPNPRCSAYDLLYKMASNLYRYNNAFCYIERENEAAVTGLYPLSAASFQIMTDKSERLYVRFDLRSGDSPIFLYDDVIHLRRFYTDYEYIGESPDALDSAIQLSQAENTAMTQNIKNSAMVRGILKVNTLLNEKDLKQVQKKFVRDYLSITEGTDGGVITLDNKADYEPLSTTAPVVLNAEQSEAIAKKIFRYLGISAKIVDSSYNEDDFAAFYESIIEPFALALSLEMTAKIFPDAPNEEIIFESNRLQFVSNESKILMIKELMPLGVLTINDALHILNMPTIAGGDKRLQSLNFVDQSKILEYQIGGRKIGAKI